MMLVEPELGLCWNICMDSKLIEANCLCVLDILGLDILTIRHSGMGLCNNSIEKVHWPR